MKHKSSKSKTAQSAAHARMTSGRPSKMSRKTTTQTKVHARKQHQEDNGEPQGSDNDRT